MSNRSIIQAEQKYLTLRDKSDLKYLLNVWSRLIKPIEKSAVVLALDYANGIFPYSSVHYSQFLYDFRVQSGLFIKVVERLIRSRQLNSIKRSERLFTRLYMDDSPRLPLFLSIFAARNPFKKLPWGDFEFLVGSSISGRSLLSVLENVFREVQDALIRFVASRPSVGSFLKGLENIINRLFNKTATVFNSEIIHTFRATFEKYMSYTNASEWMWIALPGCCDYCGAMDNSIHSAAESMNTHPSCRCLQLPVWHSIP